ncbi:TRADD-N-associated membrane domain-containing protein [Streptomyces swartbergensis]|uniref:TRADD-N-associated membrane domain-containing protein n=1 Tax=Streptomyces swartbergensis TaxID=487165 RepID=UPI00117FB307|nr:hypothetical protein [Streptomyces swartbergensis]
MTGNEPFERRGRRTIPAWLLALAAVAVGAAVPLVAQLVNPRFDLSDYLVVVFLAIILVSAGAVNRVAGRETHAITRSREQVRAAERALEAALRVAQSQLGAHTQVRPVEVEQADSEEPLPQRPESTAGVARLTLPELWAVTHRRLDLYQDIATSQAQKSFRNAQLAMTWGFVLLVVFVLMALEASTTAGSVVAGGLGAISAALAGFVSRTFVKSQETAAAHLRAYFDQPLEFSRYLAAERLVAEARLTPEQRAQVLTSLVQAMVTPPAAVPVPGSVPGHQPQ